MSQTITPYLYYEDVDAALEFLSRAFGFTEQMRLTGAEGYVNHAEMRLGDAAIYLGDPGQRYRNPKRLGQQTGGVYVEVEDVEAHFARAREAGAEVTEMPEDQAYGHRRYGAADPEGHQWWFAQAIAESSPAEAEAGTTIA